MDELTSMVYYYLFTADGLIAFISANLTRVLKSKQNLNEAYFDSNLPKANIYSIASGQQGDEIKFYLYSRHVSECSSDYSHEI